jgi:hypothetical protein
VKSPTSAHGYVGELARRDHDVGADLARVAVLGEDDRVAAGRDLVEDEVPLIRRGGLLAGLDDLDFRARHGVPKSWSLT